MARNESKDYTFKASAYFKWYIFKIRFDLVEHSATDKNFKKVLDGLNGRSTSPRPLGRPQLRWEDTAVRDSGRVGAPD